MEMMKKCSTMVPIKYLVFNLEFFMSFRHNYFDLKMYFEPETCG
jgi:hypothetical protein